METTVQHQSEHYFVHPLSDPGAPGLCPEMLEVAEEASRAGDFHLAAEIYGSQLSDLQQPDRGLCLRRADALVQVGRLSEALDAYCTAANLNRLQPDELRLLVENIARTLREKELHVSARDGNGHASETPGEDDGFESGGDCLDQEQSLDLFSCRLCKCLLFEPTTLECGHTFCKRCLEADNVKECAYCNYQLGKKNGQACGFRVNVILSSLLEKWFDTESKARKYWIDGEVLWKKQNHSEALEMYNKAVEIAPSDGRLLGQRAQLHMDMKNFSQASQDGESMCRLRPLWAEAHRMKAEALLSGGQQEKALQAYLCCVALKPQWSAVKLEAQRILSEVFSSAFEKDGLPSTLCTPPSSSPSHLKPSSIFSSPHPPAGREKQNAGSSSQEPELRAGPSISSDRAHCDGCTPPGGSGPIQSPSEHSKTLSSVLSALPAPAALKRKLSGDSTAYSPPSKLLRPDEAGTSQTPTPKCWERTVPLQLLDSADMECSLCMRLFYEPVATPCGHTFCLKCLERCLDHNSNCPLCKENLSEYMATRGHKKTLLMEEVLQRYLGNELAERKKLHEEEMKELSNLNQEVPIFVCTMAFPTVPCPLHVFEPRYRLMIRRSMETGTRQFGMCITDEIKGFADYGCMLEVRDVQFFPDGRSVVDTIGVSRFRVLSHGHRDGYNTAKIEHLEDCMVEGEELAELLKLHDAVYSQATAWFTSLKDDMKTQILSHFGHLPGKDPDPQASSSGPAWCWWLLAVLPLENRAQLTILAMTSLKERLVAIRRVLLFVTRRRP